MTLAELERQTQLDKTETRILLMHVSGLSRIELITRSDDSLTTAQLQRFQELVTRRQLGEPVAYLTGEREFFSLTFLTTPDVLIPRPDTELLVELALDKSPPNASVLDLGTGSGAIAIALAHSRADLHVSAADISTAALDVARRNAERLLPAGRLELLRSDWYHAVAGRRFDTVVSNPPYIVKDDPHLSQGDLRFEPVNALTDHGDGLSAYRTLISQAPQHLQAGGWLLMEHGYDQAEAVRGLLNQHHFSEVQSWRDLAGIERVSGGRLS